MGTRRLLAVLALLAGLGLTVYALLFLAGAAIPYQDAPQELLLKQAREMRLASWLAAAGLVVSVLGAVAVWRARPRR